MPVTQKDIARKLNISQSLVAGVLGNKPGVWVSEEKRRRIHETALEMGYRPNAAARMLRSRKSYTVAVVMLATDDEDNGRIEQTQVVQTLAYFLQEQGYELKLKLFQTQAALMEGLKELVSAAACDVVVLDGSEPDVIAQGELLTELEMPFLVRGRFEDARPDWPQIDFDHEAMMDVSVRHLASLGHRRIGYLEFDGTAVYLDCLRAGFHAAMRRHLGVTDSPSAKIGHGHRTTTEAALTEWLEQPEALRPTALVLGASSEDAWLGLELALARKGRRIGDADFAVAGLHYANRPLLFGTAYAFTDIDSAHLGEVMCNRLLLPLLRDQTPEEKIIRFVPNWHRIGHLNLSEYVIFRSGQ